MSITTYDFDAMPLPGPEGRANAIRFSLKQIAALRSVDSVSQASLADAFRYLAIPREGDTPPITARRATCAQLADALRPGGIDTTGDQTRISATPWFLAQIDAWTGSEDPRLAAMAATAARELAEIGELTE